jgi:predicted dehydrogenase
VLGVARIATRKVIPAMQRAAACEVVAIASRDLAKASEAAAALGIPRAHGSYEALLADPEVDAIYNPLPNHLHVPWSIRAAEAGKHVLCEKPIALNAVEAEELLAVRDRTGVCIQEAFMVRTHPQWIAARDLVATGRIGEVRAIAGFFSYFNGDPANVRNVLEWGGGGMLDVGCYLVHIARMILGREPRQVAAAMDRDPSTKVDRLASVILDFGDAHATGVCGTRLAPYQRIDIVGTRGRVQIQVPFNAAPDRPCRILVDDGTDLFGAGIETIEIEPCDQFTIQADLFARAILGGRPAPYPLEDSVRNMRVIDALFQSAATGAFVALSPEP